jgi:FMN phosphatase YigB (HAD superfamily)
MQFAIFDLDGTIINSNHRKATKPDGSLDLAHWFENNKPSKIALDGLYPLIYRMREIHDEGVRIVICTARTLQAADYEFFRRNHIPFHYVISRPAGDMTPDGVMKKERLSRFLKNMNTPPHRVEMWDDNNEVIAAMKEIGVKCHDAGEINRNYKHRG